MTPAVRPEDLIIGITPFGEPDAALALALARSGALGILDLGDGGRGAREALERVRQAPVGVRIGPGCRLTPADLPDRELTVVLAEGAERPSDARYRILAEVTDLAGAWAAIRDGAHGLVARGAESGGPVGELSTFVLLQQLLAEVDVPVWACGGIGPRTAAAAVAGGAAGVVLDSQLALLAESSLPDRLAALVRTLDGSESTAADGSRFVERRGVRLPVGQDGFLAARFADRWGDVRRTVRELTDAVRSATHDDSAVRTLGPDSAMGRALGTRLPVAQGPMTRVSDRAAFAAAVAEDGALPFLALALANGERSRAMLAQAREAVGDKPWGVGVLGFAPEELRTAQLEAVRLSRPTHAIIAGGRPSQARALEEAGIRTFLHVPSPELLRQFLEAGARRFVFEGAECGGHVGPRAAFPLWEAQSGVLEDFGDVSEVEVFFAGGVHDERSAAMVAALAGPLTARGAAVGVLMGTAYLFTEEAVRQGAIQPLFQERVLAAGATTLLESAPGHATRCVPSPFADGYREEAARLRARGLPEREVWEELERLNVGRLRIASKGVERDADGALASVDEQRQLAEGMFMAGEVAVLRSRTTTIADLHTSVTTGAAAFLAARTAPRPAVRPPAPAPLDVAIVGMACMFAGSPDLPSFWANVVAGVDAVTEVPPERWDSAVHHGTSTDSKWGGFLPRIPFDPLRYGIPPTSLGSVEPVQLLSLEAARRALDDAGYGDGGREFDRSRTSVVFGAEAGSDLSNAVTLRSVLPAYYGEVPPALDGQLPHLTEDSFPGMLANVISGRIANRLDLGGANYTVDAACASSLAAVDVACKELLSGTSDVVLCGGADLHNGINDYALFSSVHALSPTGRSRAFDSSADGIALGEGVACVVLKRLADAERDGDRVYGVIKGLGSSSDGRSLGLTAPRPEGQRAALERAYRNAGVSPADVGIVEAHGTGTVVGDRTELSILSEVFTESGARAGSCVLGSVKSQIGHTKCAAGLAGLIKTTLALYTGVRPPTLHLETPNPAWTEGKSPFVFHSEARPWAAGPSERVGGVSAFGFGGTNFHVVLAAHDESVRGVEEWPAELFLFRGRDAASARRGVEELLTAAEAPGRPWRLRDLALSAARRADASEEPVRFAVVAGDVGELVRELRAVKEGAVESEVSGRSGGDDADEVGGKVAFLFPGQGSQRPGMLADLFVAFPDLRHHLELGRAHAPTMYPPTAFDEAGRERQAAALTDTRVAQPALGITGLAAYTVLTSAGVHPDMAAGHSYGELVALCAAGAISPETLLELSEERASAILAAAGDEPGTMAAVSADAEAVGRALDDISVAGVVIANLNSPEQTVISGPTESVAEAVRLLRAAGFTARRLPVACAFHSPLVAEAGPRFATALARHAFHAPEFPVWANRTAAPYTPDTLRTELAAQIGAPVRFAAQIEAMYDAGARVFVEAGPGSVLTRLVGKVLGDRPHRTVACEPRPGSGLRGWLDALAQLALAGAPVRAGWLLRGRGAVDAVRTPAPKRPGWTVDGQLVRTADGAFLPGGLAPARRIAQAPGGSPGVLTSPVSPASPVFLDSLGPLEANVTTNPPQGQDALIAEFLRTSREMIAAQRDVLLTYFGAAGAERPTPPPAPMPVLEVTPVQPEPVEVEPARTPVPEAVDVRQVVLDIISERTGYPVDMIEPDLDLEADLSIDSIKRAEIAGELARRLGGSTDLAALADEELEELTKARTAAAVTDWLTSRLTGPPAAEEPVREEDPVTGRAPRRLLLQPVPLDTGSRPPSRLTGTRWALLGDAGLGTELAGRLTSYGVEVVVRDMEHLLGEADGPVDGVVYLGASDGVPVLPDAFAVLKAALAREPGWLLAVRPVDGDAVGLRGLFRSVAREFPETVARVVDVDEDVADAVIAEILADDTSPAVLCRAVGRHGFALTETPLGALGSTGAGPAGDGVAEAAALGLDRDAVVLLAGGARGIAAQCAVALARASRCRLELLGRTPAPDGPEDAATAAVRTPAELRAVLAGRGGGGVAEINREAELLLAQREIRATLAELASLGSAVRYRSVDFRESDAVLQAVKEIHAEHGRLDGVVYAAGVIEDRLIPEKSAESFRRVYATKASGAHALLTALEELPDGPSFTVLFGSISAVLGNRGQADYAAANDALEALGAAWAARTGWRALTVHWGPWAPGASHGGMVGPELAREYARRGVELIDPEEGTAALLRELAWGDPSLTAVVHTASGW